MSATEIVLWLFVAVHNAVLIWLLFDRDRMFKKIKELELKSIYHPERWSRPK